MKRSRAAAWALASTLTSIAAGARANGAFPASGQVLVDPSDSARIAVKTTYGLVTTADGGTSWQWTCEPAMFVPGGDYHPQLAIGDQGTIYGGLLDGMVRGRIGACTWDRVASLEGASVRDVSQAPGRGVAVLVPAGSASAEVWESLDDAQTWAPIGEPLPEGFVPFTLDAAPSDPSVVYVSGMLPKEPPVGGLLRTTDGGATWDTAQIPHTDASHTPYVAAIDPIDPEIVWVRLDGAPGELLRSVDGGFTFATVLRAEGFLRAFALAPDGTAVLAGGEVDGLLRASTDDLETWAPVASIAARCVRWRDDAIDVCATETLDGFTIARSIDDGATFEPLYRQQCLEGPLVCPDGSAVDACTEAWPLQADILGVDGCGDPSTGASGGVDEASSSAAAATTSTGDVQGSGGGGSPASTRGDDGSGCAVRMPRAPRGPVVCALAIALGLIATRRYRYREPTPPTTRRAGARRPRSRRG